MRNGLHALRDLAADRRGVAAPTTALALVVMLGFTGLGVDAGFGYLQRRTLQHAADSAAFSAAAAAMASAPDAADQARAVAARYGAAAAQVTVNLPPTSGAFAGDAEAVEVLVQRPGRRFFSGLFTSTDGTIRARAVARAGRQGDACVLALNATANDAIDERGTADVTLDGCSLFSNSASPTALELKGGAKLHAKSVGVVGGYVASANSTLTTTDGVHTGQAAAQDPYADVEVPTVGACDSFGDLASGSYGHADGRPWVFCGSPKINSGAAVNLLPGVYIVKGGSLTVNGGGALRGTGVTIVLTNSTASDYAGLTINGGSTVELSAPTSGPTQGLVFFQDDQAPAGLDNKINGGAALKIEGAIYFPRQKVTFTGGATTAACTQIVADEVSFFGNSRLSLDCAGTGAKMIGGTRTALVE